MSKSLVISALGNDKPGIVNELSKAILEQGGNIAESRMMVLGGEFAIMLKVTGNQTDFNKIKNKLDSICDSLGLTIISKETEDKTGNQQRLPYRVTVVSMDHPGIVHEISDFFSSRNINIEEIETETYPAAHTGTPMFSLTMIISNDVNNSISALKNEFYVFCDDLNLDAEMESVKK